MLAPAQEVLIIENDEGGSDGLTQLVLRRNLSTKPDLNPSTQLAGISPSPVVIVVDPYLHNGLTEGVDFLSAPSLAVRNLIRRLREEHGESTALVITSAIMPQDTADSQRRPTSVAGVATTIEGVPVVEKSVDLSQKLETALDGVLSVRTGFVRRITHSLGNIVFIVTNRCGICEFDLKQGATSSAQTTLKGIVDFINERVLNVEAFIPRSGHSQYLLRRSEQTLGGVIPLDCYVRPLSTDEQLDPAFLENSAGATHIARQLIEQLRIIAAPLQELTNGAPDATGMAAAVNELRTKITAFDQLAKGLYSNWSRVISR
jgi:hypothetical protein